MITNFEEITDDLTPDESQKIVPILIKVLRARVGKSKAITNKLICENLKNIMGIKTSGPRVRKMINVIRLTGEVQRLIATSKGYYVAETKKEMETYIQSLDERIEAIQAIRNQLDFQHKNF